MALNRIAVIYDTNNFIPSENKVFDLAKLNFEKYYKFKKTLKINGLEDKVKLFFPEIVLLELLSKHKQRLNERIKKLEDLNEEFDHIQSISINGFDKLNIDEFFDELEENYLNELNIIPIPQDKTKLFNDLLKMAINRYPPFIKKNKNTSDKGFKDAVIFLSLLTFSEKNDFDKYILVSNDEGFLKGSYGLKKYFKKHSKNSKTLEIIKNDELSSFINEKFELFKDLRKYIHEEFLDEVHDEYTINHYIKIDNDELKIRDYNLIEHSTKINQIDEHFFELELILLVTIDCRTKDCYFKGEEIIIQKERYIFRKNNENWKCLLKNRKYKLI